MSSKSGDIKKFQDLLIWKKSMSMVTEIYKLTQVFPSEELYALTAQLRRCAVSIPSNIAEGYGRNSTADYVRFLNIARGSLYELQTQIEIALNLKFLDIRDYNLIYESTREIERMLTSLIKKLTPKK